MHKVLKLLSRTRLSSVARYGLAVFAVVLMTLVRLVAPLDTAAFPLYLPIIFLGTLALGNGPGLVAVIVSDLLAA